jgi:peptidoglycan/LPS O-acetylase OafA/YrhL
MTGALLAGAIFSIFKSLNLLSGSWGGVGTYSYAVFLVHQVVSVRLRSSFDGWETGGVMKTASMLVSRVVGWW